MHARYISGQGLRRLRRAAALIALAWAIALGAPALAQEGGAAGVESLSGATTDDLRSLVETLRDDDARELLTRQLETAPIGREQQQGAARAAQLDRLLQRAGGARAIDRELVLARGFARAEACSRLDLLVVAGDEPHLGPGGSRRDDGAEPDSPAAHDGDAVATADSRLVQTVNGHGEGLDETRVACRDASGQRHETALGHPQLLGHAAVLPDAHHHAGPAAAQVVLPGRAELAALAGAQRLDRHRCVVVEKAGDLVAQRVGRCQAARDHVEVRAADAGGADAHAHPVARRSGNLDDLDARLRAAHRAHHSPPRAA